MSYSIVWERRGACITYSGVVTFHDFMSAVLAIHQHTDYSAFSYAIHDMSAAGKLDFSEVNITQLRAQELGARFTNPRVKASVVTVNPEMVELAINFSTLTKLTIRVFQDIDGANVWSGRPRDDQLAKIQPSIH